MSTPLRRHSAHFQSPLSRQPCYSSARTRKKLSTKVFRDDQNAHSSKASRDYYARSSPSPRQLSSLEKHIGAKTYDMSSRYTSDYDTLRVLLRIRVQKLNKVYRGKKFRESVPSNKHFVPLQLHKDFNLTVPKYRAHAMETDAVIA